MGNVIAPPPAVVGQLSDLIALIRNVDQVAKLVTDLQTATAEYGASLQALAVANGETQARIDKLARQEAATDAKLGKLAVQREAQDRVAQSQAESEANLQSAYANLQSRTDEFEARSVARDTEMDNLCAELQTALAEAEADRTEARRLKDDMVAKVARVNAELGA